MIVLYLLLFFIILAAVIAVESHNLVSSVISAGAVGLGLCIIFLLLGAPELALTQLVVEILMLIVLIRATLSTAVPETYKGREFLAYSIVILFILVFIAASAVTFKFLPEFGNPRMGVANFYLENSLEQTGSMNPVSSILLGYRSLDILGAMAALFASVIGVYAILRAKGRKKGNERDEIDS